MTDKHSAEFAPLVSHEQLDNAFWRAIRMFVGRGKRHRACEVSAASGVHRRTLDCYRGYPIGHPDHRPLDYAQKFSIASVIGADLTTQWLRLIGQAAYDLPDVEPDPSALDTAGLDAGDVAHAVAKARSPNSPGGIAIVTEERNEIVPLIRRSVASGKRAAL